ncbi:hypothetical protein QKU58_gp139 [Pyramimonas orientalis virus]|uniref:Uncharacterized protein n=1 Tax=Pyramimonas orientalis virus 01B TaxID=3134525 RepID=A0A7M3UNE3_9VIRU|nr:hypothetical protein QKU58_gp139 [Pyramimonas orientalis virus]QOI90192.1 hypothetical protein HWQ62_00055 [Pyramimonas orientalis virus]
MLYEEFEKLNCKHIQELNEQNKPIMEHQNINDIIPKCGNDIVLENDLMRKPFKANGSCALKNINQTDISLCHGYDCPTTPFYQTPDRMNTFHNYLVLEDDLIHNLPVTCTQNHQYYNNCTRRKVPKLVEPMKADMGFFDDYLQRIPLVKYQPCKIAKPDYTC